MTTSTKFPSTNAGDGTGYANPTNFYADDGSYATALPNKNNSLAHYVSGFDFSAISDGDTLNSVTVYIQFKYSTNTASYTLGSQGYVGATAKGSEYTNTNTPTGDTDVNYTIDGLTISDIKSADFKIRIRCSRGNTNTASTQSVDYIKVAVDYTSVVNGTLSQAVSLGQLVSDGQVFIKGLFDKTFGFSLSATGELVNNFVSGSLNAQVGLAELLTSGKVQVKGGLDTDAGIADLLSSGKVAVDGSLDAQVLGFSILATAEQVEANRGVLNSSVGLASLLADGQVKISGALNKGVGVSIDSTGKVLVVGGLDAEFCGFILQAMGYKPKQLGVALISNITGMINIDCIDGNVDIARGESESNILRGTGIVVLEEELIS